MSGGDDLGIFGLDLWHALHQPGCPICRLMHEIARRYIHDLLGENVTNPNARTQILLGLGFCPEHTWQLYNTAVTELGHGAGISAIYEDLTRQILAGLREFKARLPADTPPRRHWWQRGRARVRAAFARHSTATVELDGLQPKAECRVCFYAKANERNNIQRLIHMCADADFCAEYTASDGMCLVHLRQALEWAAQVDPGVAHFIADTAATRLSALVADLSEYGRKHAWEYRHEVMTPGEQDSPRWASQFFGGRDRSNERGVSE